MKKTPKDKPTTKRQFLNLAHMLTGSRANGPGIRDVFWVQGCSIKCPSCQNNTLLAHTKKFIVPVSNILEYLSERLDAIDGITITGGEPLEQAAGIAALLEGVHQLGLSTVVYTGHYYEELIALENLYVKRLLRATDLLIDGPFLIAQRSLSTPWLGSSNQRLLRLSARFSEEDLNQANVPVEELFVYAKNNTLTCIQTGNRKIQF